MTILRSGFVIGTSGNLTIVKRVAEDLNYYVDYDDDKEPWLEPGDSISSSVWTVPLGITGGSETNSAGKVSIVLSGGTAGSSYELSNLITTANGLKSETVFTVNVT